MRTTVNLDDDVALAIKERAQREGRSVGKVLSDIARQGMAGEHRDRAGEALHGFAPLPPRGISVSNALIDRLREDESE
jgi:plasmid stability protein